MRSRTRAFVATAWVAGVAAAAACTGGDADIDGSPRLVRFEGVSAVMTFLPSFGAAGIGDTTGPVALMLRDGDFIIALEPDDAPIIAYRAADGATLRVAVTRWSATLAGKIVGIKLPHDSAAAWLARAPTEDLAAIRVVSILDELDSASINGMARLAGANPRVGLLANEPEQLGNLLSLFHPHVLLLGEGDASALDFRDQQQIEVLLIDASDSGSLAAVSALPNLRQLVLFEWDMAATGPLPGGLTRLTSLHVLEGKGIPAAAAMGLPASLEELSLVGIQGLADVSALARLGQLEMINLGGSEAIVDLSPLSALTQLRWAGLPPSIAQEQFTSFVAAHPKLEIVEMAGTKNVTDVAALRDLAELRGLMLSEYGGDVGAVKMLKTLQYLGYSRRDAKEDAAEAEIAELRAALPDAVVVGLKPFCLGSGWILLILPIAVLTWLVGARSRRGAVLGAHVA